MSQDQFTDISEKLAESACEVVDVPGIKLDLFTCCLRNSALIDFVLNSLPAADTVSLDDAQFEHVSKQIAARFNTLVDAISKPAVDNLVNESDLLDKQIDRVAKLADTVKGMLSEVQAKPEYRTNSGNSRGPVTF